MRVFISSVQHFEKADRHSYVAVVNAIKYQSTQKSNQIYEIRKTTLKNVDVLHF